VAGFAVTDLEAPGSGLLVTLDVRPAHRRQGVASDLLSASEAWLLERGAREMVLQVATSNDAALAFYRKSGFSTLRTVENYYGRERDAFFMRKTLGVG
jgi:[ribosomal protein S18]-alanine N-acetyltransferase